MLIVIVSHKYLRACASTVEQFRSNQQERTHAISQQCNQLGKDMPDDEVVSSACMTRYLSQHSITRVLLPLTCEHELFCHGFI
jgi:hypothetical protein